ncbi:HAD family hydrolase [Aestuariivirga sp.]|uniref:HAD family hydrolase n=1 Tax=Aestuariivirga sp. TaxID=2650926 RepID=UPI0039E47E97
MADGAIIFDVDGVLLELTAEEEDAFFVPFQRRYGLQGLSRDWDSYKIRNDEKIVAEILDRHGLPAGEAEAIARDYLDVLAATTRPVEIPGARDLLTALDGFRLGIATANFRRAAEQRLTALDLWEPVSALAFGAEGSGHKRETVAKAIAASRLPKDRIVYIGDNLNDVEAGLSNGVHFIGFALDPARRERLGKAGARHLSGNHLETLRLVRSSLAF